MLSKWSPSLYFNGFLVTTTLLCCVCISTQSYAQSSTESLKSENVKSEKIEDVQTSEASFEPSLIQQAPDGGSLETGPQINPAKPYNPDFKSVDHLLRNKEFEDDHKLTDMQLRAQDGSLSRYSIATDMNFRGPSIGNPSAPNLPNPDNRVGNYAQTLGGNVSAKLRLDSDQSLGFGTGIIFDHPLQGTDRTDVNTPFITYTRAARWHDIQMVLSPMLSYTTTPELVNVGQMGGVGLMGAMVRDLGRSRFAVSLESRWMASIYSRAYIAGTTPAGGFGSGGHRRMPGAQAGDGNVQQYILGGGPGLKYHITDHFELGSFMEIGFMNPRSADDVTVLMPSTPSTFVSLGYAYDRDLYLAPSLQFYPTQLRSDMISVGANVIFSLL